MYRTLRTIHLLCGVFALPMLLMYGVSAMQMAHGKWFRMKPAVKESEFGMPPGSTDGRTLAYAVMSARDVRGELREVHATPDGFALRILIPGTVYELRYNRSTGATHLKTSVAGFMGMLNRLHHAAGLGPDYIPLRLWGVLVGLVSLGTLGLGATGLWMWWIRRHERTWGLILLSGNLAFTVIVFVLLRSAGP